MIIVMSVAISYTSPDHGTGFIDCYEKKLHELYNFHNIDK